MKTKLKTNLHNNMNKLMVITFILVLIMNLFVVITADDLGYTINNGILDIFKREYEQYMTWTGRSVAHIIARIFLSMPKIIFDICNSLCFVYFTYLIYIHVQGSKEKDNAFLYATVVLLVFLCVPLFGQTVLWETGSCNYLWTTTIVLWFLLPYRLQDAKKHNPVLLLLAGIPAGWTNENTGGALILMILFILIMNIVQRKKNALWMYTGLIGAIIGFLFLVFAPGNSIRALDFVSTNGKIYDFIHDFNGFLDVLEQGQLLLLVIIAIGIALSIYLKKETREIWFASFYAVCGIAAVFAIILSPVPVLFDRSMFGATTFLIISSGIVLKLLQKENVLHVVEVSLLAVLTLFSSFNYLRALPDLAYIRYQYMKREAYVEECINAGNTNPVIPSYYAEFETSYDPLYGLGDISVYRELWVNKYYSIVHGIDSVQTTTLEKWNLIYKDGNQELMNILDLDEYIAKIQSNDNYVVFINSSNLDQELYADFLNSISKLGIEKESHIVAVYENGTITAQTADYLDGTINGHYYYISSNDDESYSDVLVDNVEYTNDRPGINFVVYDKEKDKVVDSVTWTYDTDQGGTRYYLEK